MKIYTLIEDTKDKNLLFESEHGISFFIETTNGVVLFDTGQSSKFINNAIKMEIDLSKVTDIVLSHGHYDHTGGLKEYINKFGNSFTLHTTKELLNEKYKYENNSYKFVGNNFDEKYLNDNNIEVEYLLSDMKKIRNGIYIIKSFEKHTDYEKKNKSFFVLDGNKYILDDFKDEISIALDTEKGIIVIVGCSHPGIVNILNTIGKRMGKPIYGVIGGTHLIDADDDRIEKTMEYFSGKDIKIMGISHCTGDIAVEKFETRFKEKVFKNKAGSILKIKEC